MAAARDDVLGAGGLNSLSVAVMRDGIFCRGVLLDVAAARGVAYLGAHEFITVNDLESAERQGNVRVGAARRARHPCGQGRADTG